MLFCSIFRRRLLIGAAMFGSLLVATVHLCASTETQTPSLAPSLNSLVDYAASSEIGIVGKVIRTSVVGKHLSAEELATLNDLSKTIGGGLYTIQVEDVITTGTDFGKDFTKYSIYPKQILIFKEDSSPFRSEYFIEGRRYLMFLRQLPDQNRLIKENRLEANRIYYETIQGGLTLIPLNGISIQTLDKLKKIADSVRINGTRQKIQRLKILAKSQDEELKGSAAKAIEIIKTNIIH